MRDTGRDRENEGDQHNLQGDPLHRAQRSPVRSACRSDHRPALRTTAISGSAVETDSKINALRADRLPTVIATGNSKTRSPAATTS
ncbi:hypothetical protein [Ralstonia pseudosolanacearum]|uniref:hypothetical protein n=1 Tax=Ralstonia pseudosolanacearum TaxID=1310165 RepID=UPI001374796C|nr:hypothetical protein [Ralstonia pseudosolanacearum]